MESTMLLFVTAFILQFVGHQVGDFLLQTNYQAINKGRKFVPLFTHASVYSLAVSLPMLIFFSPYFAAIVYLITLVEHTIMDSRKPVIWYKNFFDRVIGGNKDFQAKELPMFVTIGIDQAFHFVRIFLVSLLISSGWLV